MAEKESKYKALSLFVNLVFIVASLIAAVFSFFSVYSYKFPDSSLAIWCSVVIVPLLLFNIFLTLFFLFRKLYVFALLSFIVTIVIAPSVVAFNISRVDVQDKKLLNIASYNVRGFNLYNSLAKSSGDIAYWAKREDIDVLALQEYAVVGSVDEFITQFDTTEYFLKSYLKEGARKIANGVALLSRHPILSSASLQDSDSVVYAMYCDLNIDQDTIRVFNIRLHTTSINQSAKGVNSESFYANQNAMSMFELYLTNAQKRAAQAKEIVKWIGDSPYPVLLCGDFNDTTTSYTSKLIADELNDSFFEAAFGYSYTYKGFYKTQRIDYVMYGDGFRAASYTSPSLEMSDHNPVLVSLIIDK